MNEHKHCKNCGYIIISSEEDKELRQITYDHPTLKSLRFKRDIAYSNGFCEQCMNEYGLDALCNFYKRIYNE